MTQWMNRWNQYLTEAKEPIEEVTEEELDHIEKMHGIDATDLSFNNLFGDKFRLVIPLVYSMSVEQKDLVKFLRKAGYTVDLTTGIANGFAVRDPNGETRMLSFDMSNKLIDSEGKIKVKNLVRKDPEYIEEMQRQIRKRRLKIGKLLKKGISFLEKDDIDRYGEFFYGATDEKTLEQSLEKLKKLSSTWDKRGAGKSGHSVIISRHPIDVLRMSDFDRIQSCHSPTSRGGGGEYYKCAVAEAHGHGLVTYLVRNEELDKLFEPDAANVDTSELRKGDYQSLIDLYQKEDEEFFRDDERNEGDITPINRNRLRKFSVPKAEVSIAVPEIRIYGDDTGYNGPFQQTIDDWSKKSQEAEIQTIEDHPDTNVDGNLNLSNFVRHGGSYKDTVGRKLLTRFLNYGELRTTGTPKFDDTTESELEIDTGYQAFFDEVERYEDLFNTRNSGVLDMSANVEDFGDGVYASANVHYHINVPDADFKHSSHSDAVLNAGEAILEFFEDTGFDRFDGEGSGHRVYVRTKGDSFASRNHYTVFQIPVNLNAFNRYGDGGVFYTFEEFEEALNEIEDYFNRSDVQRELLEEAERVLQREGIIPGPPIKELVRNIEEGSGYVEWDVDIDDEYEPELVMANTNTYVNFEDLIQKIPLEFTERTLDDKIKDRRLVIDVSFGGPRMGGVQRVAQIGAIKDERGNIETINVGSQVFEMKMIRNLKDMKEAEEYIRDQIARLILKGPKSADAGGTGKANENYNRYVANEMRIAVGGSKGEFINPRSETNVSGPDADDEYKMSHLMSVYDSDTGAAERKKTDAFFEIIEGTDDEDILKTVFRNAFKHVTEIRDTELKETKKYFNKFDLY